MLCVLLSQLGSLRFAGRALLALRPSGVRTTISPGCSVDGFGPQTFRHIAICIHMYHIILSYNIISCHTRSLPSAVDREFVYIGLVACATLSDLDRP